MQKIFSLLIPPFRRIIKSKVAMSVIGVALIGIGSFFFFHKSSSYQFVTVQRGSVAESVSLTGNTTPAKSVDLSFGSSGIIAHTYTTLGASVYAGQILAELNITDLAAQLRNAQAGLTIIEQQASASKDNLSNVTAQQDSLVAGAWQSMHSNFAAVPTYTFTTNPPPVISGSYTGTADGLYKIEVYASSALGGASFNYSGLESGTESVTTNADVPLGTQGLFVRFPDSVSASSYVGSVWVINVPNTRWSGYANALKSYQTALETRQKSIADAQANVGDGIVSSVTDAKITQARANVDSALAKIQNARIIAPISGIVTQFDAKVGQLASPSAPLASLIGNDGFEVNAGVSETDVGKLTVGNIVTMTLDAFPNETFSGKVFYIAPAQTNTQGVISYQIKISFEKPDPRLKSGLTANITIQTKQHNDVLILPQYAILQNDNGTFVETLSGNTVTTTPVTLGIQDQKGNVEILSGVTEGEQVINIGLKKTQ
ncbi:MAG: efflux RND transporter periplasmic adaptor subunit [Candidatus Paceibacterota bacterium]|jgi:RND family efflux transporter MFP subunit